VKVYLDEMISPDVAAGLRDRGHDAVSAAECGMLGASDAAQLARAIHERRALVTYNVRDFVLLARAAVTAGREHWGLVPISDRHLPPSDVGGLIGSLAAFQRHHTAAGALRNGMAFLRRKEEGSR
jgi:hypothetical protein